MMDPAMLGGLVLLMLIFLALGVPISFVLGATSVVGIWLLMGSKGLYMVFGSVLGESTSATLIAVPLYIFMANVLGGSGLAEDLYEAMYKWFGKIRGGLAIGTVIICAIFAAMAGISSVATISMGLIALPSMLKRGYDKYLAIGSISAGGALGILIPPSVIMIIYGVVAETSIGQLFMGGLIPGLILAVIYITYISLICLIKPNLGPPIAENISPVDKLKALKGVALPCILVVIVLGALYFGICTPTEAGGVGAIGALFCACVYGKLTLKSLHESCLATLRLTAVVMWIVFGATCYSRLMAFAGVSSYVQSLVTEMGMGRWSVLVGIQLIYFILGMFVDPAGIVMLTTPVFVPLLKLVDVDLVWFGILFVINMEMAYLTPPFGFNLFIMRSVVPPGITMGDIYRSIAPFVVCQVLCLVLVMLLPELALWLPSKMIAK